MWPGRGARACGEMSATQQASPSPSDARAAEMQRKAAAGESYMQLLQMIFLEKQRISANESTLMQHEQDAIRGMTASTRMYALGYGCAAGLMVGGLMRAINPSAYRSRFRFWAWVAPTVAWGAVQGMQTGVRTSTITLLNLPESPFADRLVTHLEKHVPDSPLLQEVSPTRIRANWGIDAGPESQRQVDTGSELGQTEAALGAIAVSRQQSVVKRQPLQRHERQSPAEPARHPDPQSRVPSSLGSEDSADSVGVSDSELQFLPDSSEENTETGWELHGDRGVDALSAPPVGSSDFFGNVYGRTWASADGADNSYGEHSAYGVHSAASDEGGSDANKGVNRDSVALSTAPGPEGRAARMAARKAERERREREIFLKRRNENRVASGERAWIESRHDTSSAFQKDEQEYNPDRL